VDTRAAEYVSRLRDALCHALRGSASPAQVEQRAHVLVGTTIGVWLVARFDTRLAARMCDATAARVRTWDRAQAAPRARATARRRTTSN
jgi:hypothetical protein